MHQLIAKIAGKTKICPITGKKVPAEGQRGKGLMAKLGGKDWIKDATKNKGGLHRSLGVPADEKIPASRIKAAEKKPGKVGKQARLAATLKKLGMDKEAGARIDKVKGALKRTGKYAKWGGLGMGVYLAIKALEGAGEAKQEATHRGW